MEPSRPVTPGEQQRLNRHSHEGRSSLRKRLGRNPNAKHAHCRSRHPVVLGACLLFSVILTAPISTLVSRRSGVCMGVGAVPCASANATAATAGAPKLVFVTPSATSNFTSMFACEDGDFEVFWSGTVSVPETIVIGNRTTVRIFGDPGMASSTSIDTTSPGSDTEEGGTSSSSGVDRLEQLTTSRLSLPSGLSSEAVGVGPPDQDQFHDTTTVLSTPIFRVDGGTLIMSDFIVRDGYAVDQGNSDNSKGAGIFAVEAKINATRCEFRNNFAVGAGGGIYAEESTVVAVDSVFETCRAGFKSVSGEEDAEGEGGGISTKNSYVLVDGCLFEGNYAGNKGGAINHQDKQISVIRAIFYDNLAGSESEEDKEPKGQGADLSLAECEASFDGESPCLVNDTVFANGYAGSKGGAVSLSGGNDPWTVEFHRCSVESSSTGKAFKDDPQGEGGAFSVGEKVTLVLSGCLLKDNSCGKKGGVLVLSSGKGFSEPGATVIMRNSSFESNAAELDSGGVASMADFSTVIVEGDDNVFDGNECHEDGAVFAASANTSITIEGGLFIHNHVEESGAVIWSKGNLLISDGNFTNNNSPENGGVLFASEFSTFTLAGGYFQGNEAQDGGVINAIEGSSVNVEGGVYSGNVALSDGGVFSLLEGANIQITGGNFSGNKADFGAFMYRTGPGETSCEGVSILDHEAVDGGAIYAIDGATVDWACDIRDNSAISAAAIYARENTTVILRDMSLVDNRVSRGSVIVLISSRLETYQVEFSDSSRSVELLAVQVNEGSSYMAEDTSFVGFQAEGVVFSEGELFLDNCDFSGSTSSVLIYSALNSTAVIRNAVLGDNNYAGLASRSSKAGEIPDANSFTNANLTCEVDFPTGSAGTGAASSSGALLSLCSEGSACLDGDLGVYCECYYPQRTLDGTKEERCVSGDASELVLLIDTEPGETFFPLVVEGDILLRYDASADQAEASASTSDTSDNRARSGVVWTVQALTDGLDWTIFPSTGLLLPGQSIMLRVVTQPREFFDGTTNATFGAIDFRLDSYTSETVTTIDGDNIGENDDSGDSLVAQGVVALVMVEVTYYHCEAGSFWNQTLDRETYSNSSRGTCKLCTEETDGNPEGVDCSNAGATIDALPIRAGYWRATRSQVFIRECSNENACTGGAVVQSVEDYCGEGYEGPQCAVCSHGFGRGAANECHTCSEGFKIGMYFLVVFSALVTFVIVALIAVYLIGGKDAVSSTVASTKETVLTVKRRSAGLANHSGGGGGRGSIGFGPLHSRRGSGPSFSVSGYIFDRSKRIGGKSSVAHEDDVASLGGGIDSGSGGAIGESAARTAPPDDVGGGRGGVGIRRQSRLKRGMVGLSGVFGFSRRGKTTPDGSSVELTSSSWFGTKRGGSAGGTGTDPGAASLGGGLTSAYGAAGADSRARKQVAGERRDRPTAARRIGQTLSVLPLSKVKIVIVVWQISSAFADVTNAGFPPIYDKFLSVIGIFSMDLGWILSASCLATDITFYDKLLIVTIGPMFLLGLLGITFYVGSRPAKPRAAEQPILKNQSWASTSADASMRAPPGVQSSLSSRTIPAINPTLSGDMFRSDPGVVSAEGQAAEATGGRGGGAPRAKSAEAPPGRQASWMIRVDEESSTAGGSGRNATAPTGQIREPILGSEQSLRNRWQAGPGSGANAEQNQLWGLFARHTTMTLIILYLVYSQVSTVVFQTFSCEYYHEINKSYLRADNRIECNTPSHTGYRIYAAFMICLYPLGIPAAFAFLLVRQRSAINPPTDTRLQKTRGKEHVVNKKIEQRRLDPTVAPTAFLWSAYYPNCYYFEVFECMRRLLLTGVLVFVPDSSGQVAYGCIFAFISLWAFELQRPHIDGLEIQLYRTGCLVIFFTNFLALIIQAELAQPDSRSSAVYSVVLIMVHIMFILSICWNSWATMKATFSRRHVQGMVLGVDVVDEETADNILGPEKEKGDKSSGGGVADFKTNDDEMVPAWQTEGVVQPASFDIPNKR